MTGNDEFVFLDMTPLGEEEPIIDTTVEPDPAPVVPLVEEEPITPAEVITPVETTEPTEADNLMTPEVIEDPLINIANGMLEKGYLKGIPEGVDPTKFTSDDIWTLLEHSQSAKVQEALQQDRSDLANSLTDTSKQILAFDIENVNRTDEEVLDFVKQTVYAKQITNLDPENDSEQILRQYYSTVGWSEEEIDTKVASLAGTEGLVTEATMLKPKLDANAKKITEEKIQRERLIADHEAKQYTSLKQKTIGILNTGKINGVDLSQEEVNLIYNATLNQDVDVPVRGGKTMKLGMLEAMIHRHRYDPSGNIENLMLATLVLEKGPQALEKFYGKKAKEKVIGQFVRESKASAISKTGDARISNQTGGGMFKLNL